MGRDLLRICIVRLEVPASLVGLPTDQTFTGQRAEGMGLMDYGARFYWPRLGRFISADSIVPRPGDPQSLNRFSFVLNNPLRFIDPTGHYACDDDCDGKGPSPSQSHQPPAAPPPPLYGDHIVTNYHYVSIDLSHVRDSVRIASSILSNVKACYLQGGAKCTFGVPIVQHSKNVAGFDFPPGCLRGCVFVAQYNVKRGFAAKDINNISLGIFLDAQARFEAAQWTMDFPFNSTSFHYEDLFSDYLGFYSAVSGQSPESIVQRYFGGKKSEISEAHSFIVGFWDKSYVHNQLHGGNVLGPLIVSLPDAIVIDPTSAQWTFVKSTRVLPVCGTNC